MDKKNLDIALKAVMGAQDIIGLVAFPDGKYGYENFNDEQLRDIYYKLNEICCNLIDRMEKSENIKEAK
jgi:hypothetical protein